MDTKSFLKGKSQTAYDFLGNHKKSTGYIFRIFAPNASTVDIIGDFNDWQGQRLRKYKTGIFSIRINDAKENDRYQYIITSENGQKTKKIDPFAEKINIEQNCSTVGSSEYKFKNKKIKNKPNNIYQVHLGSLLRNNEFTYEKIVEHCKANNFDYISFLPLAEYENYKSYGYKSFSLFAYSKRYGNIDDFKKFVDIAHKNDIGIIVELDIYEFDENSYCLFDFDGTNLYGYAYEDIKYNYYGGINFDPSKNSSRSYILSAINYWIREYNLDGLMLSNIENAIYWQGQAERGINEDWLELLEEIINLIHKKDSLALASFNGIYDLDLNFDYVYDLRFREVIRIMQKAPIERDKYKMIVQKLVTRDNSKKIIGFSYVDSYLDEASLAMKMYGNNKISQLKSLFTLLYSLDSIKMIFMGDEVADFKTFSVFDKVNLTIDNKEREEFNKFYNDLIKIFKTRFNTFDSKTKLLDIGGYSIYAFTREYKDKKLLILINITDLEYKIKSPYKLEEIINTDNLDYGGSGNINGILDKKEYIQIMPFGSAIFKIKEDEK